MISAHNSEAATWQEAYDEQFRINETLQKELRTLKETFEQEIAMYKNSMDDRELTSTNRYMNRIFTEILEELYEKMWPWEKK